MIFQPGFGCLIQGQPGTSFKADGKSIWILSHETDPSGLCGWLEGWLRPICGGFREREGKGRAVGARRSSNRMPGPVAGARAAGPTVHVQRGPGLGSPPPPLLPSVASRAATTPTNALGD